MTIHVHEYVFSREGRMKGLVQKPWEVVNMHIVSVLFTCAVPCLLLLDGRTLGECSINPLSAVLDGTSAHYVTAFPLRQDYCPASYKLMFKNGELTDPGCETVLWPGAAQLTLVQPPLPGTLPVGSIAMQKAGGYYITLYQQDGVHLAVESTNDLLYTASLGRGEGAALSADTVDGRVLIYARTNERCVCAVIDGHDVRQTVEADGVSTREGRLVTVTRDLDTLCAHQRRDVFDGLTGSRTQSQFGHFTRPPIQPQTDRDVMLALLDAVRLRLPEWKQYLAGDLSSLTCEQLANFFGPYSRACAAPTAELAAGLLKGERFERARLFRFSVEEGKVVNAEPW